MNRAVFLDRDGVLNRAMIMGGLPKPPRTLEEFELYPDVEEACHMLKRAGFLLVVATNQPDVGRGNQSRSLVESFHDKLRAILPLDRIEVSYDAGDVADTPRRKPAPGMLLDAARDLDINLSESYMIGDRWRDVDCGKAAGCSTIFIDRQYAEALRQAPDFTVKNLHEAACLILQGKSSPNTYL